MRSVPRLLGVAPLLVFAAIVGLCWQSTVSSAGAYTPTVTMFDNDAPPPSMGFDPGQTWWGFAPAQVLVMKGDMVVFNNPASNRLPHTVTNIERTGRAFENQLAAATKFDSSPSADALVMPGNSWTLDTSTLDPGNYAYYCRIHPWMVATLSVMAP